MSRGSVTPSSEGSVSTNSLFSFHFLPHPSENCLLGARSSWRPGLGKWWGVGGACTYLTQQTKASFGTQLVHLPSAAVPACFMRCRASPQRQRLSPTPSPARVAKTRTFGTQMHEMRPGGRMGPSVHNFHQVLHPSPPTPAKSTGEVACVRVTMSLALCYREEKETLLPSLPGC